MDPTGRSGTEHKFTHNQNAYVIIKTENGGKDKVNIRKCSNEINAWIDGLTVI